MTLLWIEGFDGQTAKLPGAYAPSSTGNGNYLAGRFSPGSAMQGTDNGSTYDEYARAFSATSTLYTGFACKLGLSTNGFESAFLQFYSGGTAVLQLRVMGTNLTPIGQLRAYTTTQLGITSTPVPTGTWMYVEMKVICGTGTSGSVVIRQNGIETLNLSGVTGVNTGSTSIDKIGLRLGSATNAAGCSHIVDDWYVCDGNGSLNNNFLGDLRVMNLVPTGSGSTTQLTPSTGANWDCVNEVPPTTADYVGSSTTGFFDLYTHAPLAAGYTNIRGVKVAALAVSSDAGAIKGRNRLLSGATTNFGVDNTLGATAQAYQDIVETDPNTSAQWTLSGVNAAQFGWEVRP